MCVTVRVGFYVCVCVCVCVSVRMCVCLHAIHTILTDKQVDR